MTIKRDYMVFYICDNGKESKRLKLNELIYLINLKVWEVLLAKMCIGYIVSLNFIKFIDLFIKIRSSVMQSMKSNSAW